LRGGLRNILAFALYIGELNTSGPHKSPVSSTAADGPLCRLPVVSSEFRNLKNIEIVPKKFKFYRNIQEPPKVFEFKYMTRFLL
jgi:hypothetical protein